MVVIRRARMKLVATPALVVLAIDYRVMMDMDVMTLMSVLWVQTAAVKFVSTQLEAIPAPVRVAITWQVMDNSAMVSGCYS